MFACRMASSSWLWDIANSIIVKLARHLNITEGETPQSLRDLSVSLEKMGDVARERGELKDAQDYYAESKQALELFNQAFPQKKPIKSA